MEGNSIQETSTVTEIISAKEADRILMQGTIEEQKALVRRLLPPDIIEENFGEGLTFGEIDENIAVFCGIEILRLIFDRDGNNLMLAYAIEGISHLHKGMIYDILFMDDLAILYYSKVIETTGSTDVMNYLGLVLLLRKKRIKKQKNGL